MAWTTPVKGQYTITAKFGETGPRWASGSHTGLDFAARHGTQVVAVDDGTVIFVGPSGRYGNLVKIRHRNGVDSWYAHLSSFDCRMLQQIKRGEPVGKVGATGNTTGDHLHLEARVAGVPKDPAPYLSGSIVDAFGEGAKAGALAGLGIAIPGADELFGGFAAVGDIVGFITDPQNWYRVAVFVGGGVLVIVGLYFVFEKQVKGALR